MEVNATGIKPSADESIQFQLGPENVASGVAKIEQADMKASESDPVFQQIASRIICSDLSNNGFEVCEVGEEEQVLEEDDTEDASSDNSNAAEEEDEVEVRGDGGRGGTYDRNNCTGEQCEDADEETQEEEEGDYCEIDPAGYCPDKNEGNNDGDNDNDDDNSGGDSDNEEGNSNNGDGGNDAEESGDGEENENANADA
jgi:hypothetical protein